MDSEVIDVIVPSDNRHEREPFLLLIPCFILISIPVRLILKKVNCVVPQNFILFIIAVIIALSWIGIFGLGDVEPFSVKPEILIVIYLPVLIVSTFYGTDYFILTRCFLETLIISLFGVFTKMIIMGTFFKMALHVTWPFIVACLAALACIPVKPDYIVSMFKELTKYKYVATALEVESMLSSIVVIVMYNIFIEYSDGHIANLYDVGFIIIIYILGGIIFGCILGKLTSMLVCFVYNEPNNALCVSLGMVYLTYIVAEYLLRVSGALSVTSVACFLSAKKHILTTESYITLERFWSISNYTIELSILMLTTLQMTRYFWIHFTYYNTFGIILTYIFANVLRIVVYVVIGFIIKRMTDGLNIKCLVVFSWGGIKGCLNFLLMLSLLNHSSTQKMAVKFVMEITLYLSLSLLINGSSMRLALQLMGLSELPISRKLNMNNCMNFIMAKNAVIITILKHNRYLANSNWADVRSKTIIYHPFHNKNMIEAEIEKNNVYWAKHTLCPDCFREIHVELSQKELDELLMYSRLQIIKAKEVFVINQYESGMISKNCWLVLVHFFELMIERNTMSTSVDIKQYLRRKKGLEIIRNILKRCANPIVPEPPNSPIKRLCFYIMLHIVYDYIMYLLIISISIIVIWQQIIHSYDYIQISFIIIFILFVLDFCIKVVGYSNENIREGFKIHFRYFWNVFDFVIFIFRIFYIIVVLNKYLHNIFILRMVINVLCLLHLLKIFSLLQCIYPKLLKSIEYTIDSRICFGYDLATTLVNCCDHILDSIGHIIEVKVIRERYIKEIHNEKIALIREMEQIQKERPWIAITVKTKQVIRTTINAMDDVLNQLKISGFVDNIEYSLIFKDIFRKQKFLRNIKIVAPSSPKVLFREVPWMSNDEYIIDFLYKNVQIVQWNTGDLILKDEKLSGGIYVIFSGMLQLYYIPKESTLEKWRIFGNIPIVDLISILCFTEEFDDNIVPGNSIGELSVLTGRPCDCTIVAVSPGQAYFLPTEVIKRAIRVSNDPVDGLEARMWKYSVANLAIAVLMDVPSYQSFSQEQIKVKLENAFIPNLRCFKMFSITDLIDDIILIEGIVADYISGEIYTAPVLIPKSVQKLILPRSSYLSLGEVVQTKLLIVPLGAFKQYDIMEYEEEIAELASGSSASSTCRFHSIIRKQGKLQVTRNNSSLTESSIPSLVNFLASSNTPSKPNAPKKEESKQDDK